MGARSQAEPEGHRGHRRHPPQALHRLHRGRRRPHRDQPADPEAHRRGARAGRQGDPGWELRVPPSRLRAVRRHPGARHPGAGCSRQGPAVRRPGGLRRRDRQRCRPGHVHRRHRQPGGRQAGQLPRHRRRRQRRRHGGRPRGDHQRPRRALHLHQHLRWHHQGRRGGQRDHHGTGPRRHRGPDRDPPRRHQRR